MRNTKWIYKTDDDIENELGLDKDIEKILFNRGIVDEKEAEIFINGNLENLMNPSDLSDVDKGVERLLLAKEKNEKVWIYGDYDVDGITSTSLCYLALKEIGVNVNYYIPLRDEGYGLNKEALSYIHSQGGQLIITVDCGISSVDEVKHCNSLGMEMIITDHHEINQELPEAYAVINPKRSDNRSDYRYFAGVGTAFMMLLGLYKKMGKKYDLYKYLDIVAIGTIADIVPLKGENRLLVKRGLELLKSSKWLGLNMLLKRIYENPMEKKFDTYDVGFIIAPIFNAAGRLEDAKMAVELFVNQSHVICDELIYKLIGKNSERKEIQEKILDKAIEKIENENLNENSVIVVSEEGFHHGVIGIVASKILDRYYKPTIIMEIKPEEGIATASCRSIEAFNMIEALNSMKDVFVKYGGHSGAAGFSIKIEKIEEFSIKINEYAKEKLSEKDMKKPIKIDSELSMIKISFDLMDKLSLLEPYGFGNSSPVFSVKGCKYKNFRQIGKEKNHLMFDIIKNGVEIKNCVWFNADDMVQDILEWEEIDIAFKLKMEVYKDKYQYKIFVEDIKKSEVLKNNFKEDEAIKSVKFPIKSIFYTRRDLENKMVELSFVGEEVMITIGRVQVGFLDNQTKLLLKKLKENYGYQFDVKIVKIEKKDENFNVVIEIEKKNDFRTLSFDTGGIFRDIKNFLLGDLEYNTIQKSTLRSIFKIKEKTHVVMERGRGIGTILKTIGLYNQVIGKKVLLVSPGKEIGKLDCSIDISDKYRDGYDFYIYYSKDESELEGDYNLIITEKECDIQNYKKIKDIYVLPKNIRIVDKIEVGNYVEAYYDALPFREKIQIIDKIRNNFKIYCTKDVKIIL
nr:single-stranded-DNA-specific exonuclease RecJ [uncultured Cetobacterium sp.]